MSSDSHEFGSLPSGLDAADLAYLTPAERAELDRLLWPPLWEPFPGSPQEQAYHSEADELFYGGSAGGGKSDLLLGLAGTTHRQSVILRREFPRLRALSERSREIYKARGGSHAKDSYNEQTHIWRLVSGRMVEFQACQYEKDKETQRGRPRDLYGWDEVTEFTEGQFRFINGWNRSTVPGQRCRVVATGNPPTSAEGEWVIRYWAPWLDEHHPSPARPGELRWFARVKDRDLEVPDRRPFVLKGGELVYDFDPAAHKPADIIQPRSRTFIPARLSDNPILAATNYGAVLQGMPEPLRSQMLYGDFSIGAMDNPWQIIPTAWVRAAQKRWTANGHRGQPLTALGVDVARGGADKTVLARRHGTWFAPLEKHPGKGTPDGPAVVRLVLRALEGDLRAWVNVDVIGVGASVYDGCKQARLTHAHPVNFAAATEARDRSGRLGFANLRAYAYWSLREALDPDQGDNLALPPDPELLADLCAGRWEPTAKGVKVEPKEDIQERIGRSPDCGD